MDKVWDGGQQQQKEGKKPEAAIAASWMAAFETLELHLRILVLM